MDSKQELFIECKRAEQGEGRVVWGLVLQFRWSGKACPGGSMMAETRVGQRGPATHRSGGRALCKGRGEGTEQPRQKQQGQYHGRGIVSQQARGRLGESYVLHPEECLMCCLRHSHIWACVSQYESRQGAARHSVHPVPVASPEVVYLFLLVLCPM